MIVSHTRFPSRQTGGDEWVYAWRMRFLTKQLEQESLELCKQLIKPGMIVIDIGAHIGYFTRILSTLVGQKGRVYAFEPCSENYPVLLHNLSPGKFSNVQAFQKAVAEKESTSTLYLSPGHSNHSLFSGYTENPANEHVETISIDYFVKKTGIKKVDFIKIDVEGSELSVIKGMRELISKFPNMHILLEYNFNALRAGNYDPSDLPTELVRLGFRISRVMEDGSLSDNLAISENETFNLICSPKV